MKKLKRTSRSHHNPIQPSTQPNTSEKEDTITAHSTYHDTASAAHPPSSKRYTPHPPSHNLSRVPLQ